MVNNKQLEIQVKLEENRICLTNAFNYTTDLTFHDLSFNDRGNGFLVYLRELVQQEYLSYSIIKPLIEFRNQNYFGDGEVKISLENIQREVLCNGQIIKTASFAEVNQALLSGRTAFFLEGSSEVLILDTFGGEKRSVEEPETEMIVRGPREGFVESIAVNVGLLRRKLKDESLRFEAMNLGKRSKTTIYVAYLEGIANPNLVGEVKNRLEEIDIDAILESGYIEQLIEDGPSSIFPTVGATERPDKLAAKLLEGRVGIMVDGTPFVLTVPYLFIEAFQNPEDYYSRPYYSSLIRLIRYLAFYFATCIPAFYVAVQTYHQEMVPTSLLISMSGGREGIPFPAAFEALAMGVTYEILREAGVRMPGKVGQSVSVVGAIVLGQAAVQAGLVTQPMIIVVALTVISGYLIPPMAGPISILRLIFLIVTTILGMFGWLMALIAIYIHLVGLRSFGVPYLAPLTPTNFGDLKDGVVRFPLWALITRPSLLSSGDRQRKNAMKRRLGITKRKK